MYLHLGQDTVIRTEDIVGIFDLDTSTVQKASREFLAAAEKRGQVSTVSYELPKSFVLCVDAQTGGKTVYLSQISPATLLRRSALSGRQK